MQIVSARNRAQSQDGSTTPSPGLGKQKQSSGRQFRVERRGRSGVLVLRFAAQRRSNRQSAPPAAGHQRKVASNSDSASSPVCSASSWQQVKKPYAAHAQVFGEHKADALLPDQAPVCSPGLPLSRWARTSLAVRSRRPQRHHGAAFARRLELAVGVQGKLGGLRLAARRSFAWRATAGRGQTRRKRRQGVAQAPAGFQRYAALLASTASQPRQIQPGAQYYADCGKTIPVHQPPARAVAVFLFAHRRTSRARFLARARRSGRGITLAGKTFSRRAQGHQRHFSPWRNSTVLRLMARSRHKTLGEPGPARRRRKRALLQRGPPARPAQGPGDYAIQGERCLNHIRGVHAKDLGSGL